MVESIGVTSLIQFGLPIVLALVCGSAYAISHGWRHVMPELVMHIRAAGNRKEVTAFMLVYGENGADPFRDGSLGAD